MAQAPQALFSVGQRVFDTEGRTGLVIEVFFLPERLVFRYLVDGISDVLDESELQDIPFAISEPISFLDSLRANLELAIANNPGLDVRFFVGRALGVPEDVLDEVGGQAGGGTLEGALGFWAARGFGEPTGPGEPLPDVVEGFAPLAAPTPIVVTPEVSTAEIERLIALAIGPVLENVVTERRALEARLTSRLDSLTELTNARFAIRQSTVTDVLNQINNRLLALDENAQEAAGVDLSGLFGLLGGFVRNPLEWFLERAEDAIQQEILDGLTS